MGGTKNDLDVLATAVEGLSGRPSDPMIMGPFAHGPNVYGNTQTGYRADLRFGADVRPVMNCHQCKTNKKIEELVFCGHVSIDAKGYSTTCTKRYCRTCLWNWYMEQAPKNDPDSEPMWNIWRCPPCRKLCCCHRCRTFGKVQRGLDMTDLQEQAGALSPARCLARALQEAPDVMHVAGDAPSKKCTPAKKESPDSLMDLMDAPLLSDDEAISKPKSGKKSKKSKKKKKKSKTKSSSDSSDSPDYRPKGIACVTGKATRASARLRKRNKSGKSEL